MDPKTSEWRAGPNVCRCCLTEGCYKDISTEYFWMGKREVYAEMLSDTLNLTIAYSQSGGPNSNSRLICELCISRLRDASDFKRQVQECEKTFTQHLDATSSTLDDLEVHVEAIDSDVKLERVKQEKRLSDDDDDFDERCAFDDDDDDDLDDEPLTKLASKIPKKESVDLLDLLDNTKATVKRKSTTKSKSVPAKKTKTVKKEPVKAGASKVAAKTEKKKKGTEVRLQGELTSVWALTLSERHNASVLIENTTVTPFLYCRSYFKCFYCKIQYSEITKLLQHTQVHEPPDSTTIIKEYLLKGMRTVKVDISELKCRICDQNFKDLDEARQHLALEHNKPFTGAGNGLTAYDLSPINGQYVCHICNKIFQTFALINMHMNVHCSAAVCETCGAAFMSYQRLRHHRQIHQPREFTCSKCDKAFATKAYLRYHLGKDHDGTPRKRVLRCSYCPQKFTEHYRKLKHLKEEHDINFTFECDVCESVFPSRRALTMHTNKLHSEKTQCEICKKCFSCISVLKNHMVCHTGERNYKCSICPKTYGYQKHLKRHMNTHIIGENGKFKCLSCGHEFSNKNDYKRHVSEWH